jgi:hypothetical protein
MLLKSSCDNDVTDLETAVASEAWLEKGTAAANAENSSLKV